MDSVGIILGDDAHRSGSKATVDNQQAPAAQRHESELAGGVDDWPDGGVVWSLFSLAGHPIGRGARRQVERGTRVQSERIAPVVGVDALKEFPVLICHHHIRLIGGRDSRVGLLSNVDACDRGSGSRIHQEHVPGGNERDDGVGVHGVEHQDVRPTWCTERLAEA